MPFPGEGRGGDHDSSHLGRGREGWFPSRSNRRFPWSTQKPGGEGWWLTRWVVVWGVDVKGEPPFTSTQGEFIIMLGKPGRYVNTIC